VSYVEIANMLVPMWARDEVREDKIPTESKSSLPSTFKDFHPLTASTPSGTSS